MTILSKYRISADTQSSFDAYLLYNDIKSFRLGRTRLSSTGPNDAERLFELVAEYYSELTGVSPELQVATERAFDRAQTIYGGRENFIKQLFDQLSGGARGTYSQYFDEFMRKIRRGEPNYDLVQGQSDSQQDQQSDQQDQRSDQDPLALEQEYDEDIPDAQLSIAMRRLVQKFERLKDQKATGLEIIRARDQLMSLGKKERREKKDRVLNKKRSVSSSDILQAFTDMVKKVKAANSSLKPDMKLVILNQLESESSGVNLSDVQQITEDERERFKKCLEAVRSHVEEYVTKKLQRRIIEGLELQNGIHRVLINEFTVFGQEIESILKSHGYSDTVFEARVSKKERAAINEFRKKEGLPELGEGESVPRSISVMVQDFAKRYLGSLQSSISAWYQQMGAARSVSDLDQTTRDQIIADSNIPPTFSRVQREREVARILQEHVDAQQVRFDETFAKNKLFADRTLRKAPAFEEIRYTTMEELVQKYQESVGQEPLTRGDVKTEQVADIYPIAEAFNNYVLDRMIPAIMNISPNLSYKIIFDNVKELYQHKDDPSELIKFILENDSVRLSESVRRTINEMKADTNKSAKYDPYNANIAFYGRAVKRYLELELKYLRASQYANDTTKQEKIDQQVKALDGIADLQLGRQLYRKAQNELRFFRNEQDVVLEVMGDQILYLLQGGLSKRPAFEKAANRKYQYVFDLAKSEADVVGSHQNEAEMMAKQVVARDSGTMKQYYKVLLWIEEYNAARADKVKKLTDLYVNNGDEKDRSDTFGGTAFKGALDKLDSISETESKKAFEAQKKVIRASLEKLVPNGKSYGECKEYWQENRPSDGDDKEYGGDAVKDALKKLLSMKRPSDNSQESVRIHEQEKTDLQAKIQSILPKGKTLSEAINYWGLKQSTGEYGGREFYDLLNKLSTLKRPADFQEARDKQLEELESLTRGGIDLEESMKYWRNLPKLIKQYLPPQLPDVKDALTKARYYLTKKEGYSFAINGSGKVQKVDVGSENPAGYSIIESYSESEIESWTGEWAKIINSSNSGALDRQLQIVKTSYDEDINYFIRKMLDNGHKWDKKTAKDEDEDDSEVEYDPEGTDLTVSKHKTSEVLQYLSLDDATRESLNKDFLFMERDQKIQDHILKLIGKSRVDPESIIKIEELIAPKSFRLSPFHNWKPDVSIDQTIANFGVNVARRARDFSMREMRATLSPVDEYRHILWQEKENEKRQFYNEYKLGIALKDWEDRVTNMSQGERTVYLGGQSVEDSKKRPKKKSLFKIWKTRKATLKKLLMKEDGPYRYSEAQIDSLEPQNKRGVYKSDPMMSLEDAFSKYSEEKMDRTVDGDQNVPDIDPWSIIGIDSIDIDDNEFTLKLAFRDFREYLANRASASNATIADIRIRIAFEFVEEMTRTGEIGQDVFFHKNIPSEQFAHYMASTCQNLGKPYNSSRVGARYSHNGTDFSEVPKYINGENAVVMGIFKKNSQTDADGNFPLKLVGGKPVVSSASVAHISKALGVLIDAWFDQRSPEYKANLRSYTGLADDETLDVKADIYRNKAFNLLMGDLSRRLINAEKKYKVAKSGGSADQDTAEYRFSFDGEAGRQLFKETVELEKSEATILATIRSLDQQLQAITQNINTMQGGVASPADQAERSRIRGEHTKLIEKKAEVQSSLMEKKLQSRGSLVYQLVLLESEFADVDSSLKEGQGLRKPLGSREVMRIKNEIGKLKAAISGLSESDGRLYFDAKNLLDVKEMELEANEKSEKFYAQDVPAQIQRRERLEQKIDAQKGKIDKAEVEFRKLTKGGKTTVEDLEKKYKKAMENRDSLIRFSNLETYSSHRRLTASEYTEWQRLHEVVARLPKDHIHEALLGGGVRVEELRSGDVPSEKPLYDCVDALLDCGAIGIFTGEMEGLVELALGVDDETVKANADEIRKRLALIVQDSRTQTYVPELADSDAAPGQEDGEESDEEDEEDAKANKTINLDMRKQNAQQKKYVSRAQVALISLRRRFRDQSFKYPKEDLVKSDLIRALELPKSFKPRMKTLGTYGSVESLFPYHEDVNISAMMRDLAKIKKFCSVAVREKIPEVLAGDEGGRILEDERKRILRHAVLVRRELIDGIQAALVDMNEDYTFDDGSIFELSATVGKDDVVDLTKRYLGIDLNASSAKKATHLIRVSDFVSQFVVLVDYWSAKALDDDKQTKLFNLLAAAYHKIDGMPGDEAGKAKTLFQRAAREGTAPSRKVRNAEAQMAMDDLCDSDVGTFEEYRFKISDTSEQEAQEFGDPKLKITDDIRSKLINDCYKYFYALKNTLTGKARTLPTVEKKKERPDYWWDEKSYEGRLLGSIELILSLSDDPLVLTEVPNISNILNVSQTDMDRAISEYFLALADIIVNSPESALKKFEDVKKTGRVVLERETRYVGLLEEYKRFLETYKAKVREYEESPEKKQADKESEQEAGRIEYAQRLKDDIEVLNSETIEAYLIQKYPKNEEYRTEVNERIKRAKEIAHKAYRDMKLGDPTRLRMDKQEIVQMFNGVIHERGRVMNTSFESGRSATTMARILSVYDEDYDSDAQLGLYIEYHREPQKVIQAELESLRVQRDRGQEFFQSLFRYDKSYQAVKDAITYMDSAISEVSGLYGIDFKRANPKVIDDACRAYSIIQSKVDSLDDLPYEGSAEEVVIEFLKRLGKELDFELVEIRVPILTNHEYDKWLQGFLGQYVNQSASAITNYQEQLKPLVAEYIEIKDLSKNHEEYLRIKDWETKVKLIEEVHEGYAVQEERITNRDKGELGPHPDVVFRKIKFIQEDLDGQMEKYNKRLQGLTDEQSETLKTKAKLVYLSNMMTEEYSATERNETVINVQDVKARVSEYDAMVSEIDLKISGANERLDLLDDGDVDAFNKERRNILELDKKRKGLLRNRSQLSGLSDLLADEYGVFDTGSVTIRNEDVKNRLRECQELEKSISVQIPKVQSHLEILKRVSSSPEFDLLRGQGEDFSALFDPSSSTEENIRVVRDTFRNYAAEFYKEHPDFESMESKYKADSNRLQELRAQIEPISKKLTSLESYVKSSDAFSVNVNNILGPVNDYLAINDRPTIGLPDTVSIDRSVVVNKAAFTANLEEKRSEDTARAILLVMFAYRNRLVNVPYLEFYDEQYKSFLSAKKKAESGMGCKPLAPVWSFSKERKYLVDLLGEGDALVKSLDDIKTTDTSYHESAILSKCISLAKESDIKLDIFLKLVELKAVGELKGKDLEEQKKALARGTMEYDTLTGEYEIPPYLTKDMIKDFKEDGGTKDYLIEKYLKTVAISVEDNRKLYKGIPNFSNCFTKSLFDMASDSRLKSDRFRSNQRSYKDGDTKHNLSILFPKTDPKDFPSVSDADISEVVPSVRTSSYLWKTSSDNEYRKVLDAFEWQSLMWN